ncbi:hypothetical protein A4H97_29680 [Niastella yeongjuensis]|uniref:Uncharacterized protein n=1 Tax=Niastella yeongjuensis TaxID=354355 RepID=A0A1V9EPK4_9BACT|nr:hypothetical protein [Niastella yeongjuensis]OQP48011.1 hypothetical protein A4H97_29680 [Niastella yeongjuensis]SEO23434.1 hypothetical protein SAMN05660816_02335 [Niastella yeongjuensis]
MKLHIFRFVSVSTAEGDFGSEQALGLIYSILLQEYKCDYYPHILVNHIGEDLEEQIIKIGRDVTINIRYLTENFINRSSAEKNEIRLDITNEEAYNDWLHSLPPGAAAIPSYKPN